MSRSVPYADQIEREYAQRQTDRIAARLVVAGATRDLEDCRLMLDMLGLLEDTSEFH